MALGDTINASLDVGFDTLDRVLSRADQLTQIASAFRRPARTGSGAGQAARIAALETQLASASMPRRGGGGSGVPTPEAIQPALAGAIMRQAPGILGGLAAGEGLDALGLFGGGGGEFYRTTSGGRTVPVRQLTVENPTTGSIGFWRYMGQPVLFKGDVDTCRRVKKVARRSASSVGLRFRSTGRRRR